MEADRKRRRRRWGIAWRRWRGAADRTAVAEDTNASGCLETAATLALFMAAPVLAAQKSAATTQTRFATPEKAVEALARATRRRIRRP